MALWKPRRNSKGIILKYLALALVILVLFPWGLYLLIHDDGEIKLGEDVHRVRVYNHNTGEVMELGLEEYVVGVVAAEMPALFPLEALKVQATAARTYTVKRLKVPDPRISSKGAHLSTDPNIYQDWISSAEMKNRWGERNFSKYRNKIVQAVAETRGTVIVHDGQLIDPVYHSSCGSLGTLNSEDVWKFKIPYLRSVACAGHPDGNKDTVKAITLKEMDMRLGTSLASLPAAKIQGGGSVIKMERDDTTGRVSKVNIGGKSISGTEVRAKLGLFSARFTLAPEGDVIKIRSQGYGHGVGMCQYGAQAMAEKGLPYEEIISHYYTGVKLAKIK